MASVPVIDGPMRTEIDAAFDAVKALHEVRVIRIVNEPRDGMTQVEPAVIAKPEGVELESIKGYIDEWRPYPERKEGTAELETVASFIDHANRFKADGESALFATRGNGQNPRLVSVLDYHLEGKGHALFCRHRGSYKFPVSDEWRIWNAPRQPMSVAEFGAFLEDRIGDIVGEGAGDAARAWAELHKCVFAPPARLVELGRGLSVRVNSRVLNAINLSSGEASISFHEEHQDESGTGPVKVPRAFLIAIPVFRGDVHYQIPVRLSYRVVGGSVQWTFALHRADACFDDAFGTACRKAQADTGLPLFYGSPED